MSGAGRMVGGLLARCTATFEPMHKLLTWHGGRGRGGWTASLLHTSMITLLCLPVNAFSLRVCMHELAAHPSAHFTFTPPYKGKGLNMLNMLYACAPSPPHQAAPWSPHPLPASLPSRNPLSACAPQCRAHSEQPVQAASVACGEGKLLRACALHISHDHIKHHSPHHTPRAHHSIPLLLFLSSS